jgi:hypothetical protein
VKKLLGWVALAIAAIWIIHNPVQAAADVRQVVHAVTVLVSAL